jgi:hypothetical protein
MEGGLKTETISQATERTTESVEMRESIERAKELRGQLEAFNNTDVVGSEALREVEDIACALSIELQNISAEACMQEGLPYHPSDTKITV